MSTPCYKLYGTAMLFLFPLNMAVFELAATATASSGLPCHHVFKYRTALATPSGTVVAVAVAGNSDMQPK